MYPGKSATVTVHRTDTHDARLLIPEGLYPAADEAFGPLEIPSIVFRHAFRFNRCLWEEEGSPYMRAACRIGSVPLVRWMRSNGCGWDAMCCACAAFCGHSELLRWLLENGCPFTFRPQDSFYNLCNMAALGGHLKLLQWLRRPKFRLDPDTWQWVHTRCHGWDRDVCKSAAIEGNLEMLQWVRSNGCPWDQGTCDVAAKAGHLHVLEWALDNGLSCDERTCAHAAYGGHLHIVQWLRSRGCPWDVHTCEWAAREGKLDVLQWAQENGCPWIKERCQSSARFYGRKEVAHWIEAH